MNRNFYLLVQGQFISSIGTQMAVMGTVFWLKQATNSASLIGLLWAMSGLPVLLLGPFGGTVADRYPRRTILIACDALSALLVGLLTYLVWAMPSGLSGLVASIFAVNLGLACINAFFLPAVIAIVPDLVPPEKVDGAISWSQSLGFLSGLFGQGLSGLVLTWVTPYLLFFMNAISFLFASVGESFIVMPRAAAKPSHRPEHPFQNFLRETREGMDYVWARRGMRAIFLTAILLNIFASPLFVLLPFYTTDILQRPMAWYGYLLAAWSLGLMMGYALVGLIPAEKVPLWALKTALLLVSALLLSVRWVTLPSAALLWLFAVGLLGAGINLIGPRSLQNATETSMRGRVLGLWITLAQGFNLLTMGVAGCMADYTHGNVRGILIGCGCAAVLISVKACLNRELSNFLAGHYIFRENSSCTS